MPATRKGNTRSSRRRAPYTKTRRTGTGKRVSALASSRVSYDRRIVEAPSVGLGQAAHTRLRTFFHYSIVLSAGGQWAGFLKPGSCFDPCGDLAALQPNLFDNWKAMYGRYLVVGASVKVTIAPQSAANPTVALTSGGTLVSYPSINSTAKTTIQDAASQPYAKTVMISPEGEPKTLYFRMDHKKVLGRRGPLDSEINGGLVTADPVANEFMVLPLFYQSAYTAATSANKHLEIEIVQDVWFDRRINVNDIIE